MDINSLVSKVEGDLVGDPELERLSLAIVYFLNSKPLRDLEHLSFGRLEKAGRPQTRNDLLRAVQYLAGARLQVLEYRFEYIEDDEIFEVSAHDVALARAARLFPHPETGEPVANFEERLSMYFAAGSTWRALREAGQDNE